MRTTWELYLDESGEFNDTNLSKYKNVSLVGGYLCTHNQLVKYVLPGVPDKYHGKDNDFSQKREMLNTVMVPIHENGIRYVVFENKEKINVVNGNITYLNILAEGICKLMYDLSVEAKSNGEENPQLDLTIATRKNVGDEGII